MQVEDITIAEYFSMEDTTKYDIFIEAIKPKNEFAGKSCDTKNLTFDEVEVMKNILANPNFEDIMELFILVFRIRGNMDISEKEIYYNASIFDLFRATNYLKEFIIGVYEKEKMWLSAKEDDRLLMINAHNRIKPFSHLMAKVSLAKMFGKTPQEIGKWRYVDVFNIQAGVKTWDDLQKEYAEIK